MARAKKYSADDILELREVFSLSQDGQLTKNGKPCSTEQPSQYYLTTHLPLSSGRAQHYAHRIVFILSNGYDPAPLQVDHIDRDSRNNHPSNLRAVTRSENQRNRRSFAKNRDLSAFLNSGG